MYELISQPGFQFYILQLHGSLQWTFKVEGSSDKHRELTENDLRHAQDQIKAEDDPIMDGVKINVAALEMRLVKNIGHLVLTPGARDGDTTVWNFEGLEELCKGRCVGTQTDPTFPIVIRGAKLNQKPLIDAATEACLQSHGRRILSILCEDPSGTRCKIMPGGVVKRLRASEYPQENSTDDLPAVRRTSARLRSRQEATMISEPELLLDYLYLEGELIHGQRKRGISRNGHVCLDRNLKEILFWTSCSWALEQEIVSDKTTHMSFEPFGHGWKLEIMHGGNVVFTKYHPSNSYATMSATKYNCTGTPIPTKVFVEALKRCVLPLP